MTLDPKLTAANGRLNPPRLAALLARHLDPGWRPEECYATGPCPRGVHGCVADSRAAYAYPSTSGGAPWVLCHHTSCGFRDSVFELLVDRLNGSRSRARQAILDAAHAPPPAHADAAPARSVSPARPGAPPTAPTSADLLEALFPRGNLELARPGHVDPHVAVVLHATAAPSKAGHAMLTLDLGIFGTFVSNACATYRVSCANPVATWRMLSLLAPEHVGRRAAELDPSTLIGRRCVADVGVETGDYGPRLQIERLLELPSSAEHAYDFASVDALLGIESAWPVVRDPPPPPLGLKSGQSRWLPAIAYGARDDGKAWVVELDVACPTTQRTLTLFAKFEHALLTTNMSSARFAEIFRPYDDHLQQHAPIEKVRLDRGWTIAVRVVLTRDRGSGREWLRVVDVADRLVDELPGPYLRASALGACVVTASPSPPGRAVLYAPALPE